MTWPPAVYWLTQTAADVPGDSDWLAERERQKLEELRYVKRRADWRLGRWTAKRAVCTHSKRAGVELSPVDVEIVAAKGGAPVLSISGSPADIGISISHSGGLGFCAVGPRELALGCDAEAIARRSDRFVEDFFTSLEFESVRCASADDRPLLSTLIWSAKESVLKALGEGLRRDTRSIATMVSQEAGAQQWDRFEAECAASGKSFYGWWRRFDDFVLTIATDTRDAPVPVQL
jgi:4'-phosphopantetheinyl transferase